MAVSLYARGMTAPTDRTRRVAAAFDRARGYDQHAEAQRRTAARLARHILAIAPPAPRVLEIGCGTGLLGAALIDRLPGAHWTMTDIAPAMLERARARFGARASYRVMDGERPDLPGRFDLICSSLAMQWFGDLPAAVPRLAAMLSDRGRLAFATLAEGSFAEWHAALAPARAGAPDYPSADALAALGLDVMVEDIVVDHDGARDFLRALKAIGAGTPRDGHVPATPGALRRAMMRFEAAGAVARYRVALCTGTRALASPGRAF